MTRRRCLLQHRTSVWCSGIDSITLGGLPEGRHVIAIKASNVPKLGPGGLVSRLFYTKSGHAVFSTGHESSSARMVVTAKEPVAQWTHVDFDDRSWSAPGRKDCNAQWGYPEIAAVVGENSRWIWGAEGCHDTAPSLWFRFTFGESRDGILCSASHTGARRGRQVCPERVRARDVQRHGQGPTFVHL